MKSRSGGVPAARLNRTETTPGNDAKRGTSMAQLSYIQFYGALPLRGRSALSLNLPDGERDYVSHVDALGHHICPSGLIGDPSFQLPIPIADIRRNITTKLPAWCDQLSSFQSEKRQRTVNNSLVPIRWECGLHMRSLRDDR